MSVSEVDYQDTWQRVGLGVAVVAPDGGRLDTLIERIRRYVDDNLEVEVCDVAVYYMEESPVSDPVRGSRMSKPSYPRSRRVNAIIQEVLAEEIERLTDPRLGLVTVTGVDAAPDMRHATVFVSTIESTQIDDTLKGLDRGRAPAAGRTGQGDPHQIHPRTGVQGGHGSNRRASGSKPSCAARRRRRRAPRPDGDNLREAMSNVPEDLNERFPDLEKAGRILAGADEIVLTCHIGPDGDAMGSMLAVAVAAVAAGKRVFPSFGPPFAYSPSLRFLPVELLVPPDAGPGRTEGDGELRCREHRAAGGDGSDRAQGRVPDRRRSSRSRFGRVRAPAASSIRRRRRRPSWHIS